MDRMFQLSRVQTFRSRRQKGSDMLSQEHFDDLDKKGYTVVNNVLTATESEDLKSQFENWTAQFRHTNWPATDNSIIQTYNICHLDTAWSARLKAKPVFADLWKTDKLLTSFDAVAIGRPPEDGQESFQKPDQHWLHLDQYPRRIGLHAYQGGVYLEEACVDDWTFAVLEGSHNFFQEFYDCNPFVGSQESFDEFTVLTESDIQFYKDKGCAVKRVPVPRGGMALWDARLVHANARPVKDRKHPGRWRYVVLVSMTPAIWASAEDLRQKRKAYEALRMTTHWSSQGIGFFSEMHPDLAAKDVWYPTDLPEVAKTTEAKQLAGVFPYDYTDGKPNGPGKPKWDPNFFRLEN